MLKINVIHLVTTRIDELYGGDAVQMSILENLDKTKFDSLLVCLLRLKHKDKIPLLLKNAQKKGIKTDIVYLQSHFDLRGIFRIKRLLKKYKISVLHCHDYQSNFFGFFSTIFTKTKMVATIHGWLGFAEIKGNTKAMFHERIDVFLRRRFNKVIAVSKNLKEKLIKQGCFPDKVELIYNGIEINKFISLDQSSIKKELNIKLSSKVIGSVGRLSVEKGFKYFIEAAAHLSKIYDNIVFILVGDGPQKKELEDFSTKLGIKDRITFTGFCEDVIPFLSCMDIFVFPSLWEGFGLALIEAMALGKPSITTDVGIVPEIINDGINGILIEKEDSVQLSNAIVRLLSDEREALLIGIAAKKTIEERFSLREMIEKYEKVYTELATS